jgi:hypothetical protein
LVLFILLFLLFGLFGIVDISGLLVIWNSSAIFIQSFKPVKRWIRREKGQGTGYSSFAKTTLNPQAKQRGYGGWTTTAHVRSD